MKKIKEEKINEKEWKLSLQEIKNGEFITLSGEPPYWYDYTNEKTKENYLVIRKGECDFKKCKNVCCKFTHYNLNKTDDVYKFYINFGKKGKHGGVVFEKNCKQLCSKSGECNLWNKDLPKACKQFPQPQDSHYLEVYNKCSFYFIKIKKLTPLN